MFRIAFATVFVLSAVICSSAKPQQAAPSPDASATLLSTIFSDDGAGNFVYTYETSNQIKVDAKGQPKQVNDADGKPTQVEVQQGSYSFVANDGQTYQVDWIADENGYQPKGAHLPIPPAGSA